MTEKMMTSFDAENLEPGLAENSYKFFTRKARELGNESIVMSLTPTKYRV